MALRNPSRDIRLFIGGTPVHGSPDDPDSRTLRTLQRTNANRTDEITTIGDTEDRHAYIDQSGMDLAATGWFDEEHGIRAFLDRSVPGSPAPPGEADIGEGLPVTFSMHGSGAGSPSTIGQSSQWTENRPEVRPAGKTMISAAGHLSDHRAALCLFEQRLVGAGDRQSPGLSQATQRIPIRATADRLFEISGQTQFSCQMQASVAAQYMREDDDVRFLTGSAQSQITGVYRVANVQASTGVPWTTIIFDTIPAGGDLSRFSLANRQSVDGLTIIDTFTGARAGLVHVSDLDPHDGQTIGVSLEGQAPGSTAWTTLGAEQTAPTAAGQDFSRAFWFDLPENTRGLGSVRVRVRFLTSANVPGARNDYAATVRADFAPREVHH